MRYLEYLTPYPLFFHFFAASSDFGLFVLFFLLSHTSFKFWKDEKCVKIYILITFSCVKKVEKEWKSLCKGIA